MVKMMGRDTTALLPNGEMFGFWERENHYDRILYVDGKAVGEGYTQDAEDGSEAHPYHTIFTLACTGNV